MAKVQRELMMGNEAMARGLVENGCSLATAYPGTPASEILAAVARLRALRTDAMHVQWAVNEKVAFEIAYAGCQTGLRTAVSMKQVGLNVASRSIDERRLHGPRRAGLSSSAPTTRAPIPPQTEQDSRLMADDGQDSSFGSGLPRGRPGSMTAMALPAFRGLTHSGDAAAHHPGLPQSAGRGARGRPRCCTAARAGFQAGSLCAGPPRPSFASGSTASWKKN